jgi:hypothetical protein
MARENPIGFSYGDPDETSTLSMTSIVTKAHLVGDPAEVFDYITTPAHWPEWHPSSLAVTGPGADHPALVGEEMTEEFQVAGRRGSVLWRVVEREVPTRWVIDGVIAGRSNGGRISYELAGARGGTDLTRTFTYPTPGILFELADKVIVKRRVKAESAEALKRLAKRLGR